MMFPISNADAPKIKANNKSVYPNRVSFRSAENKKSHP